MWLHAAAITGDFVPYSILKIVIFTAENNLPIKFLSCPSIISVTIVTGTN